MYLPDSFAVTDPSQLHDWIEAFSFATLVSAGHFDSGRERSETEEIEATHLPLLLDREAGPFGTLVGHFARANSQWRSADGQSVLGIFQGPHAYVSPRWYERSDLVPTWNYVAVHATGRMEVVNDLPFAVALVRRMTEHYEASFETPWQLQLDAAALEKLATQIVPFRIPIERLEGKAKLSQNHPSERRRRVIDGLREQPSDNHREIAALMEQGLNAGSPAAKGTG